MWIRSRVADISSGATWAKEAVTRQQSGTQAEGAASGNKRALREQGA
jgi:hypothetical protein